MKPGRIQPRNVAPCADPVADAGARDGGEDTALGQVAAVSVDAAGARVARQNVASECPCEIRLNGKSHTILMATPRQLEELALGYCLSEDVVQAAAQVQGVSSGRADMAALGPAYWVDVRLAPDLARRAKLRRMAPSATSCSLCGLESLRELPRGLTPVPASPLKVDLGTVFRLLKMMEAQQDVFTRTGGTHAVALGTPEAGLISVAEDVGRHNALDKALGMALRGAARRFEPTRCLAILSGRMSYEMALKLARVGIPLAASVSAPTGLCLRLLEQLNITLIAFCRPPRATIFSHPERVSL